MGCFSAEDDASRALKVLRSGKAPLAKKRQLMRAMTGDYRRKMAEEKEKQLKLLQSGELNGRELVVKPSEVH